MKKQIKQSTLCNIMATISGVMAVLIFLSGLFTAILFTAVTGLNSSQATLLSNSRHLVTAVNYQKDMLRCYALEGNTIFLNKYNEGLMEDYDIEATLASMKALTREAKGQEQLQAIKENVDAMRVAEENVINLIKSGRLPEAKALAFGADYGALNEGFNNTINDFEDGMQRDIGMVIQKQSKGVFVLGIFIEVLCVILIIIQISNAIATKKMIIKPIIKLKNAMGALSEGQLSFTLDVPADHTEIGELAGAMLNMRDRIGAYIQEIDSILHHISKKDISVQVENHYVGDFEPIETSLNLIIASLSDTFSMMGRSIEQISNGAEHVSGAAQSLAQGAAEQANSVEQLSTAINQVSTQIKSNAKNASEANSFAITAESNLNSSNEQMTMMMNAMTEISASSAEIGKIIKTIEDIAFQTNILALNAAVEAARAGAAGKGFAVVADEVRNLATKSSEAAKQTNVLIENSVKSVEHGVRIANETAHSLSEVVTGSLAMADLITKISAATTEQSDSISRINENVEQISMVVQTNSATSQQSAAASEELSNQSTIMKSMVDAYKINHTPAQNTARKILI